MKPHEDPNWPRCEVHGLTHWCHDMKNYFELVKDSTLIEAGLRYCVPIAPAFDLYAEVSISGEEIGSTGMYRMALIMPDDAFSQTEDIQDIGYWSNGEGRMAIALSVIDYADGYARQACTASIHTSDIQATWKAIGGRGFLLNFWCLFYYGWCWPCHSQNKTVFPDPSQFNAAASGLGQSSFPNARQQTRPSSPSGVTTTTTTSTTQSDVNPTMRALRERYGNGNRA